jgi:hypothetical protein
VLVVLAVCGSIASVTPVHGQPAPGQPDPEQLAARERHPWPALIPVIFLALVAGYAVLVAARRRKRAGKASGPRSTQDPPPLPRGSRPAGAATERRSDGAGRRSATMTRR